MLVDVLLEMRWDGGLTYTLDGGVFGVELAMGGHIGYL
jgi:hypothetical protein